MPCSGSQRYCNKEADWIFEELPKATILSVSRPETTDFSPMLLSYTIEFQYKQVSSVNFYAFDTVFKYNTGFRDWLVGLISWFKHREIDETGPGISFLNNYYLTSFSLIYLIRIWRKLQMSDELPVVAV